MCGDWRGKRDLPSRIERYFAEVPKWVILSSSIRRGMARSSGMERVEVSEAGAGERKGEPS